MSSTVQDEEAIEEACDEVGSRSGTTDDDEEGAAVESKCALSSLWMICWANGEEEEGQRFLFGAAGAGATCPRVRTSTPLSPRGRQCFYIHTGGVSRRCAQRRKGKREDGLGVDAEEFAVVVELLEPRVERGRFDGVGLLFQFGNHVEKDGGVALGLGFVAGGTKGVGRVSQHALPVHRKAEGSGVPPAFPHGACEK